MPIIVKDYTWRETDKIITLRVPLHGAPKSKVDLLTSENYLKASFEQFFFELFPTDSITVEESKCTINEKEIFYELCKKNIGKWQNLERILSKEEKKEIKRNALQSIEDKLKEELESKQLKKSELKKSSVSEAITLDTKQRNTIENIRSEEKIKALGDVEMWRKQAHKPKKIFPKPNPKPILKPHDHTSIPMPRNNQTLEVEFTPRTLPTPSRESQEAEETEWLTKQAEARRSAGFVSEDLRPEEKNPQYLLAKGDEFLKNRNYLGAISAYSFGIEISPKFVDFYIKRSEAQFDIGNFHKSLRDCTTALDLMKPAVCSNLLERVTCISRRGKALYKLGLKRPAIDELNAALKLKPDLELEEYLQTIINEKENDDTENAKEENVVQ